MNHIQSTQAKPPRCQHVQFTFGLDDISSTQNPVRIAKRCPIFKQLFDWHQFTEQNHQHMTDYNHWPKEWAKPYCEYGLKCFSFQRISNKTDQIADRCHITIYRHHKSKYEIEQENKEKQKKLKQKRRIDLMKQCVPIITISKCNNNDIDQKQSDLNQSVTLTKRQTDNAIIVKYLNNEICIKGGKKTDMGLNIDPYTTIEMSMIKHELIKLGYKKLKNIPSRFVFPKHPNAYPVLESSTFIENLSCDEIYTLEEGIKISIIYNDKTVQKWTYGTRQLNWIAAEYANEVPQDVVIKFNNNVISADNTPNMVGLKHGDTLDVSNTTITGDFMNIIIATGYGIPIQFKVKPLYTIWDVKYLFHKKEGLNPLNQKYVFVGERLKNGDTLKNFQNDTCIHLVIIPGTIKTC